MVTKSHAPPSKSALDGHRLNAFGMDPHKLVLIGHDTDDGPEHPLFDPRILEFKKLGRKAVEYLIPSLLEEGFIHYPLVRKNGNDVEVGVGRNRVFAARFIVEEKLWTRQEAFEVPVVLKKYTDERWRSVILAENFRRKDSDPITEARALAEFVKHQPSRERLREITGMGPAAIEKLLALVQMPGAVQQKVLAHKVPRAVAMELARMNTRDQMAGIDELLGHGLVTVEVAKAIADRSLGIVAKAPRRFYLPEEVTLTPEGPRVVADGTTASAAPAAPAGESNAPVPVEKAPREATLVPPKGLLREMLAEATDHGSMVGSDNLLVLKWVLTGDPDALKTVPKLKDLVRKAMKRLEARRTPAA
jgi:ParB-like chromosome segregation protein Spo0J